MFAHSLALILMLGPAVRTQEPQQTGPTGQAGEQPFEISRGEQLGFVIPAAETLNFDVNVHVPILGETGLGRFQLSAQVEAFHAGLRQPDPNQRMARIRGIASGEVLNYRLMHQIDVRLVPQVWPMLIYQDQQSGSENRRKEIRYGTIDGSPRLFYRPDTHCDGCDRKEHFIEGTWPFSRDHHCKGCKRATHRHWSTPRWEDAPEHSLDMLSAIYLARAMIKEKLPTVVFPMLDKNRIWVVTMIQRDLRTIKVPAGTFECRALRLTPEIPDDKDVKFRGLFGIHGSLSIWLDARTGVPVKIEGKVPAGPVDVDVAIELREALGTPAEFKPIS